MTDSCSIIFSHNFYFFKSRVTLKAFFVSVIVSRRMDDEISVHELK